MNYCFASDCTASRHSTLPTPHVAFLRISVTLLCIAFHSFSNTLLCLAFQFLCFTRPLLAFHFPRVSLPLISVLFLNCAWLFYSVPQQLCSLLLHCPAPRYTSPPSQSIAVHFYQLITIASTAKRASCNQMVSSTFY